MNFLSAINSEESDRNYEIRKQLSEILQVEIDERLDDDESSFDRAYILVADGVRVPLFINTFRGELGESDPSIQAGISMRRSWIRQDRAAIRDKCCCPTLMLAGGGAWMCVLGGVFADKIIVQRLTDMMWVGCSSTEEDSRVYRFARVLVALRQCIEQLSSFYKSLSTTKSFSFASGATHPRFYPYPTSFTEKGKVVHFAYVKMLEDDAACVTYQAKISGKVISPNIVVKFVTRYGREVHEFLANHDHAPKLWYCGPMPINDDPPTDGSLSDPGARLFSHVNLPSRLSLGPMQMIVMDYISAPKIKAPSDARKQLEGILELLHSHGYVLGDFRRQNILFDMRGKAKIIDLDWAGRCEKTPCDGPSVPGDPAPDEEGHKSYNYVRYPLNLSKTISWAAGVTDFAPIRPEHDKFMLKNMYLDT